MKRTSLLLLAALLIVPSCRFIHFDEKFKNNPDFDFSELNSDDKGESIKASDNFLTIHPVTGEFSSVNCGIPCDLTYTPGDCSVEIYAPDNILQYISVENADGTLNIRDQRKIRSVKGIKIRLSSQALESATFNGAVDFSAPQGLTALDFVGVINGAGDMDIQGLKAYSVKITINGAGDAEIRDIDCDNLQLDINGAGDATVSGKVVNRTSLNISGAGDIDARELNCSNIDRKVRGIGSIKTSNN